MSHRFQPKHPIVAVGAVVMRDNQILLIKRGKAPRKGEWSLPGGAVELGETLEDAIKREVKEETGLDITPIRWLANIDSITHSEDRKAIDFHYVLIDFLAKQICDKDPQPSSDALDARYFDLDEAIKLVNWSSTKQVIEQVKATIALT